ncbi:MAG: hypothetical protein Unbinned4162contig1001_73 [Prokaryotic dsDNA virus sp.]|nr:MAG: hypothetical protein Unbinned4162contig1001_73 [Prokaryotic dsDNA virus sp.]
MSQSENKDGVITIPFIRKNSSFCMSGVRRFCKQHNIDFTKLRSEGIPASELRDIEDPLIKHLLEKLDGPE